MTHTPTRTPASSSTSARTVLPDVPPGDVTAGLDWAIADHAVAIVDNRGTITDQFLIDATGAGLRELVRRLRGVGEIGDCRTRARGHRHPHAVRIVARAWLHVIWRCWQDHQPYDPAHHRALPTVLHRALPPVEAAAASPRLRARPGPGSSRPLHLGDQLEACALRSARLNASHSRPVRFGCLSNDLRP